MEPALDHDVEELRRNEERLQAVIDAAPVGILEVDLETTVVRCNPAAERLYGWSRDELVGRPAWSFVPSWKRGEMQTLLERIRAGNPYTGFETVRQRRDGSLVDVEISAAPVRDGGGRVVSHMVVFSDITKRKRQEEELTRLNAELEARLAELVASRSRIVEAADTERRRLERNLHDGAQQRLVSLALSLRMALRRLDDDPEAARAALLGATDELAHAIEELRELARGLHPALLTERGLEPAIEALALRAPVPVEVAVACEGRLPAAIEAAAYYVVSEALTNVAKYAGCRAATVRVAQENGSLVVEVCDDGVGGAAPAEGSGLRGLADRVEALNGRILVTSPVGVGTTLRADIPTR